MVVQNNPTPWVILVLFVMAGCVITGMLLGNVGPLNPQVAIAEIPIRQTQGALESIATQSAMYVSQTQQAPIIQQTAIVAQITSAPLQQVATQASIINGLQEAQANATQNSIANSTYIQNLSVYATATAFGERHTRDQATGIASFGIIGVAVLLVCCWIGVRVSAQLITARAREKVAQAYLLAEQRRSVALLGGVHSQMDSQSVVHPTPVMLTRKPLNRVGQPTTDDQT